MINIPRKHLIIFTGSIVVLSVLIAGGYQLAAKTAFSAMRQNAEDMIRNGNYAAALSLWGDVIETSPDDMEAIERLEEVKRLLVAEENYKAAAVAAESGDWFAVEALLRGSDAVKNDDFTYFSEAEELYESAKQAIASDSNATAAQIAALRRAAEAEREKRQDTENTLETAISQKQQTEAALNSTKAQVEEANEQIREAKEAILEREERLQREQNRAAALALEAEREKRQKFINELAVYADMLGKGDDLLSQAVLEIEGKRDITALMYIGQSNVIINEATEKIRELRGKRTPSELDQYAKHVADSAEQFASAAKTLRNSIVYIEEQGDEAFKTAFNDSVQHMDAARSALKKVNDFLK